MRPSPLIRTTIAFVSFACAALSAAAQPIAHVAPDGKPHTFEMHDKQFFLDDQPTLLIAGELHFSRVLAEDWPLRIKQAKAMGLNTLSFYLFWNQVEPREGKFDFTGVNDVRRVLQLCQENGMWAILRPGPYCCAEVEYGGIPYWTLKYPEVKIRTNDAQYVEWSRRYIEQVYRQVGDLQFTKGGPLLMVQMENEYGMVGRGNNDYLHSLQTIFRTVGFDVPLFTCDPFLMPDRNPATALTGILRGRNGLRTDRDYQQTIAVNGDLPPFVPELYTAWFSGWGQPIATRHATTKEVTSWTTDLLDKNVSFCYYMFFGGTNYGFSNGCNEYLPVQTSYDYSAPIDEAGRTTEKYRALRDLLTSRLNIAPPAIPADPPVIELPAVKFTQHEPLLDTLPSKPTVVSAKPVSMENLDQAYGFVLYRKKFPDGLKGTLELKKAMDYTLVMVNGRTVGKSFAGYGPNSSKVELNESGPVTLDLLVYNLGRISVIVSAQSQNRARKGLIDGTWLDGKELEGWDIYSLPMEKIVGFKASSAPHIGPTFYRGEFTVDKPGGTFLDLSNWGFGVVWVNGHNLGRFWDRGALRSLFLPSHFLKPGKNEIVVLELHDAPKTPEIFGVTKIVEDPAVPFPIRLDRANLAP
jgi:beta-galactosidase